MIRVARYGSLTAAAGLLLGFLAVTLPGRQAAFADVIANVRDAETVTFTNRQKIGVGPAFDVKWSVKGTKYRMDFPGGAAIVADLAAGRAIQLDTAGKRATVLKVAAGRNPAADIVGDLRKVKPEDVTAAGEQEHEGRTVSVYRSDKVALMDIKDAPTTILVDPKTELPVRITIEVQKAGEPVGPDKKPGSEVTLVFDDFAWNVPLADDLFSLEPPAGYAVVEEPAKP